MCFFLYRHCIVFIMYFYRAAVNKSCSLMEAVLLDGRTLNAMSKSPLSVRDVFLSPAFPTPRTIIDVLFVQRAGRQQKESPVIQRVLSAAKIAAAFTPSSSLMTFRPCTVCSLFDVNMTEEVWTYIVSSEAYMRTAGISINRTDNDCKVVGGG